MLNAEKVLSFIIESKIELTNNQILAVYNNLDVVNSSLGNFDKALEYSFKAESYASKQEQNSQDMADIYVNRGHLFNIKKSYDVAIEYLEKSIRIYGNLDTRDKHLLDNLSIAYVNISIAYIETKKYALALQYLEKNVELSSTYKLSGLSLTYLNIAKTCVKSGNSKKAEEFFHKCITSFKKEFNEDYYRLTDVYFDYGIFLNSIGRKEESLKALEKASQISIKNYGNHHTIVSLSYKLIGDHYMSKYDYPSALNYYQKALIAVSNKFNNQDIFTNPSIDSSLFDIRLLDNLKSKAQALELFADTQSDRQVKIRILNKSLETMDLALELIDRIRNNYLSEESMIYLAENEKETYLFAVHLAYSLYSLTNDKSMGYKMYSIAQKAKAAILRNEITGNELLYSNAIPDSLREKQKNLSGNISAYSDFILEEIRSLKPDSNKISLWKDALFDMNREKEKVTAEIERIFPMFHDLTRKTEPDSITNIQNHLKKDETIVDYLVSNKLLEGKRKLYIFLISHTDLTFRELSLDSLFVKDAEIIRNTNDPSLNNGQQTANFNGYTQALNNMYLWLIKPVESLITGKKLIIIPDEEIGWLTFDAFLKNKPDASQTDYEGLHFLIQDYTFSYGYSSSLIFSKQSRKMTGSKVFAFSPDYSDSNDQNNKMSSLKGAGTEIGSVFKWFKGKSFSGENATKANFIALLHSPAIFHFAMHALEDSTNSRFSYLMFDSHNYAGVEARLYNYEISVSRISSPMVVLSACNSGTGTLYYGEGMMSLARGFTLAGASSVIKTAWEINDEASSSIMTRFYHFLAKGMEKNEAMRLAKLEYLNVSLPSAMHPYYWAAYEVLGDNAPVAHNLKGLWIILFVVVIIGAGEILFYFNRRRIFSDRTL
jgi:CHAT domain-containing protein/tetratricopeptide (TPR) repeat protein